MALHQRGDAPGRARFLLTLTLSTVTALGVAAPLAFQALRADDRATIASPGIDEGSAGENDPAADRSLSPDGDADTRGGIGSRALAKAQGQTSKSDSAGSSGGGSQSSVLTNPTGTTAPATTTTTLDTSSSTIDGETTTTTTDGSSTTDTTDPSSTTSSSTSSSSSSSSTTETTSGTPTTAPGSTTVGDGG